MTLFDTGEEEDSCINRAEVMNPRTRMRQVIPYVIHLIPVTVSASESEDCIIEELSISSSRIDYYHSCRCELF